VCNGQCSVVSVVTRLLARHLRNHGSISGMSKKFVSLSPQAFCSIGTGRHFPRLKRQLFEVHQTSLPIAEVKNGCKYTYNSWCARGESNFILCCIPNSRKCLLSKRSCGLIINFEQDLSESRCGILCIILFVFSSIIRGKPPINLSHLHSNCAVSCVKFESAALLSSLSISTSQTEGCC
jgi:hypothetical protein